METKLEDSRNDLKQQLEAFETEQAQRLSTKLLDEQQENTLRDLLDERLGLMEEKQLEERRELLETTNEVKEQSLLQAVVKEVSGTQQLQGILEPAVLKVEKKEDDLKSFLGEMLEKSEQQQSEDRVWLLHETQELLEHVPLSWLVRLMEYRFSN